MRGSANHGSSEQPAPLVANDGVARPSRYRTFQLTESCGGVTGLERDGADAQACGIKREVFSQRSSVRRACAFLFAGILKHPSWLVLVPGLGLVGANERRILRALLFAQRDPNLGDRTVRMAGKPEGLAAQRVDERAKRAEPGVRRLSKSLRVVHDGLGEAATAVRDLRREQTAAVAQIIAHLG